MEGGFQKCNAKACGESACAFLKAQKAFSEEFTFLGSCFYEAFVCLFF